MSTITPPVTSAGWIGSGAVSGSRRKSSTDGTGDGTDDADAAAPSCCRRRHPPRDRAAKIGVWSGVLVERVPAVRPSTFEQLLDHHVSSFRGFCHP